MNVLFLDAEYEDVTVSIEDGDVFFEQGFDVVLIPRDEAVAFADALKALVAEQS